LAPLVGGSAAAIVFAAIAAPISRIALSLGPADFAALIIFVLLVPAAFIPGSIIRTIAIIVVGLLLRTVGPDLETEAPRFTFGVPELSDGIGITPLAIGVLVVAEIIHGRVNPGEARGAAKSLSVVCAGALGFLSGLMGAGSQGFVARAPSQQSFEPDQAEPSTRREIANDANVAAGYFGFIVSIPLVLLGLPTSAMIVLIPGYLVLQGIVPGAGFIVGQPQLFWSIFSTIILICAVSPLIIIVAAFFRLPRTDFRVTAPLLMLLSCICAYMANNSFFDVWLTILFGVVGYVMIRVKFDRGLFLIAFILGNRLEESLRRTFLISKGDPFIFVQRPIAATFLIATVVLVISGAIWRLYISRNAAFRAQQGA
jgi:putative tricarboxylic transport membrane protein